MSKDIDEKTRQKILEFLPDALAKAMTSYNALMEKGTAGLDSKAFTEHHAAGKAAIAHIELLAKLARYVGAEAAEGNGNNRAVLAAVMAEAEEELARYRGDQV